MIRLGMILPLLAALAFPCLAQAEEGYTIRLRELGVGDTVRVRKDESQTEVTQLRDFQGRSLFDRINVTGELSHYTETIQVKEPNKAPSRLRRTYDKAFQREGGQLKPLVYNGRTVIIERKKERFQFWLTGRGELTAAEAVLLDREFNRPDERFGLRNMLPAGPVRAGNYPWVVAMEPLVRDLARTRKLAVDANRAKGTGQLKRVWRDDHQRLFGEFVFQLELPLNSIRFGREVVVPQAGAKGASQMTMELCIDGSVFHLVHKDTMHLAAVGPRQDPDGNPSLAAFSVQAEGQGSREEIPQR